MSAGPELSVVVPTLDEAGHLPGLLTDLQPILEGRLPGEVEVVVVDGGSADETVALARKAGARTVRAPSGRGRQLRAGADDAEGRWLFFVHADCRLDDEARSALDAFLSAADERDFAHFDFALDGDDFIHRFIELGQDIRERWLGLVYGDQGLVVSRSLYEAVGGCPDWPLMEDVGIIRRLSEKGRRVTLDARMVTSDRRYAEEGGIGRWMRNVALMCLFSLGVPPRRLTRWYRPRRGGRQPVPAGRDGGPNHVVGVFAKAPVEGRVKTRLAADVGDARAVEIYRAMGRSTLDALRGGSYRLIVFGTPADPDSLTSIADWLSRDGIEVKAQSGGDLGRRMANAAEDVLAEAKAVVIVGTDIPGIDEATVTEAFRRLRDHDVVIGPATDGGYYLVGLSCPRPELFEGIEWSTSRVLAQTLDRITSHGLSVALLEEKSDVDTVDDLSAAFRAGMAREA